MSLMSRKPQISLSSDSTGADKILREARVCSAANLDIITIQSAKAAILSPNGTPPYAGRLNATGAGSKTRYAVVRATRS